MTELLYNILPTVCVFAGLLVGIWITGGFRRGAIYLPPLVADPKPPSLTELKPCEPDYKPGDMVLVKSPSTTEALELTETYPWFMSGKQRINPDHIIGGYRP